MEDWEWAWCKDADVWRCGVCDPGGTRWGTWDDADGRSEPGGGGNWDPNWFEWWANNEEADDGVTAEVVEENGDVMEAVDGPGCKLLVEGGDPGDVDDAVGHWNWLLAPDINMSRIKVSIGVLPTNRTKKSCSMTVDETVRSEGRRNKSFPNLVGWFGYCVLQYSSRAHWDFSCSWSIVWDSERPHASIYCKIKSNKYYIQSETIFLWFYLRI